MSNKDSKVVTQHFGLELQFCLESKYIKVCRLNSSLRLKWSLLPSGAHRFYQVQQESMFSSNLPAGVDKRMLRPEIKFKFFVE